MPLISIPTSRITDWESFHDVFAEALGFPDFYGRNLAAWHDCLMYADKDVGMLNVVVADGDVLTLVLEDATAFATRCPPQYLEVLEGAAWVNHARITAGLRPIVAVSSSGSEQIWPYPPASS